MVPVLETMTVTSEHCWCCDDDLGSAPLPQYLTTGSQPAVVGSGTSE